MRGEGGAIKTLLSSSIALSMLLLLLVVVQNNLFERGNVGATRRRNMTLPQQLQLCYLETLSRLETHKYIKDSQY